MLPPDREDSRPFVHVADLMRAAGVNVPRIHAADLERGFLLLEDLGSVSYLDRLDAASAPGLYRDALDALVRLQTRVPADAVPPYDEARLSAELELFPEWFLGKHLGRVHPPGGSGECSTKRSTSSSRPPSRSPASSSIATITPAT